MALSIMWHPPLYFQAFLNLPQWISSDSLSAASDTEPSNTCRFPGEVKSSKFHQQNLSKEISLWTIWNKDILQYVFILNMSEMCHFANFGVSRGYPLKKSSILAHLFTAYGQFCYFLSFFLPLQNFRGASPSLKVLGGGHAPILTASAACVIIYGWEQK